MRKINILVTCNNKYYKCTLVTILSVIDHNKNNNLEFIVFIDESIENTEELELINKKYDFVKINIVCISGLKSKYLNGVYCKNKGFISAYYRLFIFKICSNLDRILYLDSDIVCNGSLDSIFFADIEDKSIGGVREYCFNYLKSLPYTARRFEGYSKYIKKIFDYSLEECLYINSGVLLIDFSKIDKEETFNNLISLAKRNNNYFHDQTIINVLFKGKIKYFDYEFNMLTDMLNNNNKRYEYRVINDYKQYFSDKKPILIHYTPCKPWQDENVPYSEVWNKYNDILMEICS